MKLSLPPCSRAPRWPERTGKPHKAPGTGAAVTFSAIQSGYSRDHDDQADRAGLRYGYEAGFNVNQEPKLWRRFAEKYGSRIP